jgi:NADP-dependent 3-hydroxy acid dehydrogenase YdfG
MPFSDYKTALVTGASTGMGAAIVERFCREGLEVHALARNADRLGELAKRTGCIPHAIDVCDLNAVTKLTQDVPFDIVVNNAGVSRKGSILDAGVEDIDVQVEVNLQAVLHLVRLTMPGMVARDRGHIVNIGSVAGEFPYPGGNAYGATKAFVRQFSLNLRADLLGSKVRVSNIEPGMAETEFSVVRFGGDANRASSVYAGTQPLSAEDIAETVEWVVNRPAHVNVNTMSIMPVSQAFSAFAVNRKKAPE